MCCHRSSVVIMLCSVCVFMMWWCYVMGLSALTVSSPVVLSPHEPEDPAVAPKESEQPELFSQYFSFWSSITAVKLKRMWRQTDKQTSRPTINKHRHKHKHTNTSTPLLRVPFTVILFRWFCFFVLIWDFMQYQEQVMHIPPFCNTMNCFVRNMHISVDAWITRCPYK